MDLNYYLHREQVERVRADQAEPGAVRDAHHGLAELYRREIDRYRAELMPAAQAPLAI
mgnify:CR=1 FL=1